MLPVRGLDDSYYKLNKDNAGFYRTNYPPARLAKLGKHTEFLSSSDKIGLIGDAGALALSGNAATPGLLALVQGFSDETDYLVWSQILGSLATVKSIFSENQAVVDGLKRFILSLITPAVERIGWVGVVAIFSACLILKVSRTMGHLLSCILTRTPYHRTMCSHHSLDPY